jgi:hypothetical protein
MLNKHYSCKNSTVIAHTKEQRRSEIYQETSYVF